MSATVDVAVKQAKLPTDLVEKPPVSWDTSVHTFAYIYNKMRFEVLILE